MFNQHTSNRPKLGQRAIILSAVVASVLGFAARDVFADPAHAGDSYGGAPPPFTEHDQDIDACFAEALKVDPKLVVDTLMKVEGNRDGKVISASAPTPQSPSFQACIEAKAMSWTLPLPPEGVKPPPPTAGNAVLAIMFPIRLPRP